MLSADKSNPAWQAVGHHYLRTTFVVALAVRLINFMGLGGRHAYFAESDTVGFWALGSTLDHLQSFGANLLSMTFHMPLYPLLLGGVQALFGDHPWTAALLQTIFDAGTCVLIAALGGLISRKVGLLAGLLAAFSATLIVISTQLLTDSVCLFFFTACLYAGARYMREPNARLAFVAGLAGGVSLLVRPAPALLFVVAVPAFLIASLLHGRRLLAGLIAAGLFAAGVALPVAPVISRNVAFYGAWNLESQNGEHLAFWVVPLVTERAYGTPFEQTADRLRAEYAAKLAANGLSEASNPFRLDDVKIEVARAAMAQLPLKAYAEAWIEGMVVNLAVPAIIVDPRVRQLPKPSFYNTPGQSLAAKARNYIFADPGLYQGLLALGVISMLPFLVLQGIGLVLLFRANVWMAICAVGVLAYFLLVNGPIATPKYRLPMEPVLIVLTAIALERLVWRRPIDRFESSFTPVPHGA